MKFDVHSAHAVKGGRSGLKDHLARSNPAMVPTNGAPVVECVNKKPNLGVVPLRTSARIGREIFHILDSEGIRYAPIGASALGTVIKVPEAHLERPTSNLFEIQIENRNLMDVTNLLKEQEWKRRRVTSYFSITYLDEYGGKHKIPTVQNQSFLENRERLFVTFFGMPTEWYRKKGGILEIVKMEGLQSAGETMMHKVFRAAKRDREDLAQVALVNDVGRLFGDRGIALAAESLRSDPEAHAKLVSTINRINDAIRGFLGKGYDDELLERNISTFSGLKHV